MKSLRAALIAGLPVFAACTHSIHQVQVSDFQPYAAIESGNVVKGYAEQFVVLGFTQETNYVNEAVHQLADACPVGELTGITTQISTSHGFLSWKNKALIQGLCVARVGYGELIDSKEVRKYREQERKRKPTKPGST